MKKIALTVYAAMALTFIGAADMNASNTDNAGAARATYDVEFTRLSKYLGLSDSQSQRVYNINELFRDQQNSLDISNAKALTINLGLMKGVLTQEQYRKYLTLLNVTSNNARLAKQDKSSADNAAGLLADR